MKFEDVFFGWFLGVLGTPLLLGINTIFERRRFLKTLKQEMNETRYKLALRVKLLKEELGELDKKSLDWVIAKIESCSKTDDYTKDFLQRHKTMLKIADAEFSTRISHLNNQSNAISPTPTPYLSSRIESLGALNGKCQADLLNFIFFMENLNTKANENSHWVNMSFSVEEKHSDFVSKNRRFTVAAWVGSAESAIECIEKFEKSARFWNYQELVLGVGLTFVSFFFIFRYLT